MNNLYHIYDLEYNLLQTLGPLPIYILIFAAIYFIMIRPQVKQQKKQSEMLKNLKKGDKVITQGGILGTISKLKGKNNEIIELDVNSNKIDIIKSSIKSIRS
tara:strand:- start:1522 stop:1827 length:306 start_codon:yes stop_codon:yes gene_type:complete